MNPKQSLLENVCATDSMNQMMAKIDFGYLEKYVARHMTAFVKERNSDVVKYDLAFDIHSPTDAFISGLMEAGSVQLLKKNGLLQHEHFIDALYLIISAINRVVTNFLHSQNLAFVHRYRYFDADPQFVILEGC